MILRTKGSHEFVAIEPVNAAGGRHPDHSVAVLEDVGDVPVGQSVGSSVVSQNSIAESRQPCKRANPERTITSNQDTGHSVASETVGFREGLEVSGVKTEQSAAKGPHPEIVLRVLRQGVDAGVGQPVLLIVSMETRAIKPREPAAIIPRPQLAICSGQYRHHDVAWKTVRLGKSSDKPILESN